MTINGMSVAASFNGGGVSSLAYDANNVDEVSVTVSGGMGDAEVGGPVMNLVPRSGGNTFKGQLFWNTAGTWSRGDNLDDELRNLQTPITLGPGIIGSYDFNPSYGGPIKRDKLWFWGSYRRFSTSQGVEGIFANKYALDPARWDYLKDESISARNLQGRDIYQGRITAQVTPKNRVMFSHEYQLRCEGSTLTPTGEGCRQRGTDWIALGSTAAVARSEHRLLQASLLRDPGDVVGAGHQPAAARGRLLAVRVLDEQRTWTGCPGWDHGVDPGDGAVGHRRPSSELRLSRREQLLL